MYTRRKFFLEGTLATSALMLSGPLKTFAKLSSPFRLLNSSAKSIALIHSCHLHDLSMSRANAHVKNEIIHAIKDENSILLDNQNYNQPYLVINKGEIKVGIISTITNTIISREDLPSAGKNFLKDINYFADLLKTDHHCNLVVLLSNSDLNKKSKSVDLAKESANIDVIIAAQVDGTTRNRPVSVLNKSNQEVIINYTGHDSVLLGSIEVGFDHAGIKNSVSFNNILTTSPDKMRKMSRA